MTRVQLTRRTDGGLVSCRASGHAGYAERGSDIVCSALTVLLRTTVQVLSEREGITVDATAVARGELCFTAASCGAVNDSEAWLQYAGIFLEKGLTALKNEFPAYIELDIQTV